MKISIITVVLNNARHIGDCLRSVQEQTHPDVEHVVVDGGSTDGTLDCAREYKDGISVLVSEPDAGIYDAMNKGIGLASGEIIGTLNSDDYYPHKEVLSMVEDLFRDATLDACYGDLVYVHAENTGRLVRSWKSCPYRERRFYWGWMPPHPTFFVRRRIYEKYGVFNLELGTAADYELMLRFLLRHKIKTGYIPDVLIKMRMGGVSNVSLKNRLVANYMDRYAWRVNGLRPYPWTVLFKPLRKLNQYCLPK